MRKTIIASALALLAGLAPAALLNIKPGYPLITAMKTRTATVTPLSYNAATDQFLVNSMPVAVQFFAGDTQHFVTGTKALTINAVIDSTGALVSGTFTLTGTVSNGTTTYGPSLLTGTLTGFGFLNQTATTDAFDFRATVTGGDMAPLYAGKDIGLAITSENSTFTGSFAVNFIGGAKVNTGSIPGPNNGSIGDFVWNDTDRDGIQDAGEPGINGVTVELLDSSMNVIATQVTHLGPLGQNGYYQFTGLAAGDYYVRVVSSTVPAGFVASPVGAGGDTTVDSNPPLAPVNLPTNAASDQTIDFGYYLPATGRIGNYVWNDANRDGIQNDGPTAGLDGVTVYLRDAITNAILQTTTTSGGGAYIFEGLSAGNYKVEVDVSTLPPGMVASPTEQGTDQAIDSNVNGGTVNLPADSSENLTVDFGYNAPCSGAIGDRVWNDLNRNGVQDAGEPGMVGIPVMLYSADGGTLLQTTSTGVNGIYTFNGLCAGTYQVKVDEASLPPGFVPTPSLQGGDTTADSNGSPATVTLPTDTSTDVTIDFGYEQPATGTIGDFVWNDLDADGVQDAGEPGIDGVTLYLYDASHVRIATEITHDGGQYLFTGLTAGSYTVEIEPSTLPEGYIASPSLQGGDTTKDSNPLPAPVTLPTDSSSDITIDFGYYEQFPAIVIVKYTNDQDANLPPGPFIPVGAAVNWEYVVTNIGNVPLTNVTVTDDHGVAVTCPKTSLAPAESMTCTASGIAVAGQYANIGSVTGTPPIGPPVTDDNPSHYFGVAPAISIVKYTNGEDADVAPGPSIMVGGAVLWTYVVTNTGNVQLDYVSVTDNMGVTVTCPKESLAVGESMTCTANGTAVAGQYANIGSAAGIPPVGSSVNASNPSHYYGFVPLGSIGDRVWNDVDKDGVQDAGETGLVGWTVKLINPADNSVIATATTGSNGIYTFPGLPAGNYKVCVVPLGGYAETYDLDGLATMDCATGSLATGQNRTDFDFGYCQSCVTTPSSIESNFNATNISQNSYLWFNSHMTGISGTRPAGDFHIYVRAGSVAIPDGVWPGGPTTVQIPDSVITFSTTATTATTSFNTVLNRWEIVVPHGQTGDIFMAGVPVYMSQESSGAQNPVTWTATFSTDAPGIDSISWQWSAAVYTSFSTNLNNLGLQTVDGTYQAGAPAAYLDYVVGGARGGGGSNYTGSNSATKAAAFVCPTS